jgi:hypothetical protein
LAAPVARGIVQVPKEVRMAALRKRSEVGTRVPKYERTPDGTINNCALANGEAEKDCQICIGCPDVARFEGTGRTLAEQSRAAGGGIRRIPRDEPGTRANVRPDERVSSHDFAPEVERVREELEQRAGEEAFAAAAGDEGRAVEVTWGDELFQPGALKFNPMRVGPFTASTLVRRGESIASATLRLHREIAAAAQKIFDEKSEAYLKNLAGIAGAASRVEVP